VLSGLDTSSVVYLRSSPLTAPDFVLQNLFLIAQYLDLKSKHHKTV